MRKIILLALVVSISCTSCGFVNEKGSLTTEAKCGILAGAGLLCCAATAGHADLQRELQNDAYLRAQATAERQEADRYALLRNSIADEKEMRIRRKNNEVTAHDLNECQKRLMNNVANCLHRYVLQQNLKEDLRDCMILGTKLGDPEERENWIKLKADYEEEIAQEKALKAEEEKKALEMSQAKEKAFAAEAALVREKANEEAARASALAAEVALEKAKANAELVKVIEKANEERAKAKAEAAEKEKSLMEESALAVERLKESMARFKEIVERATGSAAESVLPKSSEPLEAPTLEDYRHLRHSLERAEKLSIRKESVMATQDEYDKAVDDLVAAMEKCTGKHIGKRRENCLLNSIFRDCIANGIRLDDEEERAEWMKIREFFVMRDEQFFISKEIK